MVNNLFTFAGIHVNGMFEYFVTGTGMRPSTVIVLEGPSFSSSISFDEFIAHAFLDILMDADPLS